MRIRPGDRLTLGVVAAVVALDQLTKTWALRSFADGPTHVVWTLELVVAHNTGAAFSLFSGTGAGPILAVVAVVIIAVVVRSMRDLGGRSTSVAVGLVVGGALGNLVDRAFRSDDGFMHGGVVDWINFQWWPVFNVADMAVVVGAIVLAIRAAFPPKVAPGDGHEDDAGSGSVPVTQGVTPGDTDPLLGEPS